MQKIKKSYLGLVTNTFIKINKKQFDEIMSKALKEGFVIKYPMIGCDKEHEDHLYHIYKCNDCKFKGKTFDNDVIGVGDYVGAIAMKNVAIKKN